MSDDELPQARHILPSLDVHDEELPPAFSLDATTSLDTHELPHAFSLDASTNLDQHDTDGGDHTLPPPSTGLPHFVTGLLPYESHIPIRPHVRRTDPSYRTRATSYNESKRMRIGQTTMLHETVLIAY